VTLPPGYASTYAWSPRRPEARRLSTSPQELLQISIAFLVLTLDFVLLLYAGGYLEGGAPTLLGTIPLWLAIATAATASATAFVAHELAHKFSAQRRGYWAEFRWSPFWLALSVVTAFLGFLFAAPGATVVGGMGDPREWARTSLAGPLTNLGFAGVFYAAAVATASWGSIVSFPLLVIAFFNGWFGAFNLVPIGPLDGAKVLRWSTATWIAAFVVAAAVAGVCYYSLFFLGRPLV